MPVIMQMVFYEPFYVMNEDGLGKSFDTHFNILLDKNTMLYVITFNIFLIMLVNNQKQWMV